MKLRKALNNSIVALRKAQYGILIMGCILTATGCDRKEANQPICMNITKDSTFTLKSNNWSGGVSNIAFSMNAAIDSGLSVSFNYPKEMLRPSADFKFYTLSYAKGNAEVDTCLEYYATSVEVSVISKSVNPIPMCFKFNKYQFSKKTD
ncbi:hypothetical protein DR864_24785 [Runella rosea]|uniref:Lipoprotein n=1 Tax=Runella rosea TaxID=2259595 RepID=A0A344TPZ9_9BACT|nr:hypothetical protein [Runella rosea]AXE20720.1 hypothetical protein DR864_24785 [Runella rosea]